MGPKQAKTSLSNAFNALKSRKKTSKWDVFQIGGSINDILVKSLVHSGIYFFRTELPGRLKKPIFHPVGPGSDRVVNSKLGATH